MRPTTHLEGVDRYCTIRTRPRERSAPRPGARSRRTWPQP